MALALRAMQSPADPAANFGQIPIRCVGVSAGVSIVAAGIGGVADEIGVCLGGC